MWHKTCIPIPMRLSVCLGSIGTLLLSITLASCYRLSESYRFVSSPKEEASLLFKIGVYGSGAANRELSLPGEFEAQAQQGDRLVTRHHWLGETSESWCSLEAALWRGDRRIADWAESPLRFPWALMLMALIPLGIGAFAAGSTAVLRRRRLPVDWKIACLMILTLLSAVLLPWWRWHRDRSAGAVSKAVDSLKGGQARLWARDREGYWTGDVAELYRKGLILKEVAEADTAPLNPLVDRPRPYHGYFVVAMKTGQPHLGDTPVTLKDPPRNRETFAICIYPADDQRPDRPVYMICPWGVFRSTGVTKMPIETWPTGEWRQQWGIVD